MIEKLALLLISVLAGVLSAGQAPRPAIAVQWKELARKDQGVRTMPGSDYYTQSGVAVERSSRGEYRVRVLIHWGVDRGQLAEQGRTVRQYRGATLKEVMQIALAAEQHRTKPNEQIMTTIREAIYAAEDSK